MVFFKSGQWWVRTPEDKRKVSSSRKLLGPLAGPEQIFRISPIKLFFDNGLEAPPATTTAGTAATSAAAVSSPESATTRRLLAGLVDGQSPAAHLPAIHCLDGRLGIRLARHLDKGEAPRAPGVAVHDDLHLSHLPPPFLEEGADL
jgi:hypothetical protein